MKVYGGVWVGRVPDDPPHARQVRVIVAARSRAAVAEILRGLGEQVSVSYLASHWCETGNHEELAYGAAYPGEAIVTTM